MLNTGSILEFICSASGIIAAICLGLYFLRPLFSVLGVFATKKFPETQNFHKYAILIAARNEEAVIGNLIDSINKQDYPSDMVTVFVIADNCTDNTKAVAQKCGAVCYERSDNLHRTKGYALEYLVNRIDEDYGIENFEAYFVFDADNLLKRDYISRMNEAFDSGEKIVTSYRNTKNFADNWISASYGIHWLRTIRFEHRARSVLGLATRIQGTGFMFASEIIKDGWHYVSFTEDRAFAADAVVDGYPISYCDKAEFFDEQPTSLRIAMRQRIRWAKGHLQAFAESGPKLLVHVFSGVRSSKTILENRGFIGQMVSRLMSYDMFTVTFPSSLVSVLTSLTELICTVLLAIFAERSLGLSYWLSLVSAFASKYMSNVVMGAYVLIAERKRIRKFPFLKQCAYCMMWPMFDIIGKISMLFALFMRVEWKPIPHKVDININELK